MDINKNSMDMDMEMAILLNGCYDHDHYENYRQNEDKLDDIDLWGER